MTLPIAAHPLQPLVVDAHGTVRFRENKVVRYLLDKGGLTMNDLARVDLPAEDREQFAQLMGYSLNGFGELSYVSDATYAAAQVPVDQQAQTQIAVLEQQLAHYERLFAHLAEVTSDPQNAQVPS